jgi:hypothetical protein
MNIEYVGFPSLGFEGKNICVMFVFSIVSFMFDLDLARALMPLCAPRSVESVVEVTGKVFAVKAFFRALRVLMGELSSPNPHDQE